MKQTILFLIFISIVLFSSGQNIIKRFNEIQNLQQADKFITDYPAITPSCPFRSIDSIKDTAETDSILLSLEPGDTITIGKYLNKIVYSQQYTSCFAESFILQIPLTNEKKADSILREVNARFRDGELFSEIAIEFSRSNEPAINQEWRINDLDDDTFPHIVMNNDSGSIFLVPYPVGNFFYIFKKNSINFQGKTSNAFRLYKSDYNELIPPATTIYRRFNEKGELLDVVLKDVLGNKVIYTTYFFPQNKVIQEVLTTKTLYKEYYEQNKRPFNFFCHEEETKAITYEFFTCSNSSKLRKSKKPERFIRKNKPTEVPMSKYETLVFNLKNDTLLREDFTDNYLQPRFQVFKYCDSLINVYDYYIRIDTVTCEEEFTIKIKEQGKLIQSHWIDSSIFDYNSYKPNATTEQFFTDSVQYSDLNYHYNNEPQWLRILDMIRIEGPVYINVIHEFECKLISKQYAHKSGNIITTEIIKDKQGRILEIIYKKNGKLYQRREIEYQK